MSIDENEYSLDEISIAVDDNGRCYLNLDDDTSSKTWKCDLTCRTLDNEDKEIIIDLKNEFCDDCIDNVRDVLQPLDDGCQPSHFYKFSDRLVDMEETHLTLIHLRKKGLPTAMFIWLLHQPVIHT